MSRHKPVQRSPLSNLHGWHGGWGNSTLVIGKVRRPGSKARKLYEAAQVGTAVDHLRCVHQAVCEWIVGTLGVLEQSFKPTDTVAIYSNIRIIRCMYNYIVFSLKYRGKVLVADIVMVAEAIMGKHMRKLILRS